MNDIQQKIRIQSNLKAGVVVSPNHNETLEVRTKIRAGKITSNHNENLRR